MHRTRPRPSVGQTRATLGAAYRPFRRHGRIRCEARAYRRTLLNTLPAGRLSEKRCRMSSLACLRSLKAIGTARVARDRPAERDAEGSFSDAVGRPSVWAVVLLDEDVVVGGVLRDLRRDASGQDGCAQAIGDFWHSPGTPTPARDGAPGPHEGFWGRRPVVAPPPRSRGGADPGASGEGGKTPRRLPAVPGSGRRRRVARH